jgi:hypothetical protein
MWPTDLTTWLKLGGALAVLAAAGAFYLHVRALAAEAAEVPGLEQRITSDDRRAAALSATLAAANAARADADRALSAWQASRDGVVNSLKEEEPHVVASQDGHCAPSAADRELRNSALAKLTGFGPAAGAARLP